MTQKLHFSTNKFKVVSLVIESNGSFVLPFEALFLVQAFAPVSNTNN